MKSYTSALIVLVGLATAFAAFPDEWITWKQEYAKEYQDEATELRRYVIWQSNKNYIDLHNANLADTLGYTLGLNEFSDLDPAEFVKLMTGAVIPRDTNPKPALKFSASSAKVPSSVDWRPKGYVTPVKNQGQCGSCWAFSTTGALEGQHFNSTGKLVSLSEQNLVDCSKGNYGCQGGWPYVADEYIMNNKGIDTEESYPYKAEDEACRFSASSIGATMSNYVKIREGSETDLTQAAAEVGPISVCIDAAHSSFQNYQSGVYYEPACSSTNTDHCVLVVGYGASGSQDYYIVKNSWGTSWGMDGYIYMSRNRGNNCAIASYATYPIVP